MSLKLGQLVHILEHPYWNACGIIVGKPAMGTTEVLCPDGIKKVFWMSSLKPFQPDNSVGA